MRARSWGVSAPKRSITDPSRGGRTSLVYSHKQLPGEAAISLQYWHYDSSRDSAAAGLVMPTEKPRQAAIRGSHPACTPPPTKRICNTVFLGYKIQERARIYAGEQCTARHARFFGGRKSPKRVPKRSQNGKNSLFCNQVREVGTYLGHPCVRLAPKDLYGPSGW